MSEEAADIIHIKGINWNANPRMMNLFLELRGLALTETMAVAGLGIDGAMSTLDDVAHVVVESSDLLEGDTHVSVDNNGHITVSGDEHQSEGDSGGGPCSFTPQTPVATNHGEQAISTLKVGEKVLAYNPKTHKMELEPVLHVWLNHDNDLVDLTLTTTTHASHSTVITKTSEVIHTNQKHPFFTVEKGFVPVAQLHLGMHVLRADGTVGVVTGWKVVPGMKVMYNLTVAQDHTFTVGTGEWVVHNTAGGSCASGGSEGEATLRPGTTFEGDYEHTIETSQGPVTMLANAKVEGTTVTLSDVAIYGVGEKNLTGLYKDILRGRTQLAQSFADLGFDRLEIQGIRVPGSSSASPGKGINLSVDLTPYQ